MDLWKPTPEEDFLLGLSIRKTNELYEKMVREKKEKVEPEEERPKRREEDK